MSRCSRLLLGMLLLGVATPVHADGICLNVELVGDLQKDGGTYQLATTDDGNWTLQISKYYLREGATKLLKEGRSTKVIISGSVPARTGKGLNPQLTIKREVRVLLLTPAIPGYEVTENIRPNPFAARGSGGREMISPKPFAARELEPGDIIHKINEEAVDSEASYKKLLKKYEGKKIKILVGRDGQAKVIEVALKRGEADLGVKGRMIWAPEPFRLVLAPPKP